MRKSTKVRLVKNCCEREGNSYNTILYIYIYIYIKTKKSIQYIKLNFLLHRSRCRLRQLL